MMFISGRTDPFLELEAGLRYQMDAVAELKKISAIALSKTPNNSFAKARFKDADDFHVGVHMWQNFLPNVVPNLMQQAFANTLAAIETAPRSVQDDILNLLLPVVDKYIDDCDENDDEAAVIYYCSMMHALGPRLDPSNQSTVLKWTIDNVMANIHYNKFLPIEDDQFDTDVFANGYHEDAKAKAGNDIFAAVHMGEKTQSALYSEEVITWVSTLLPKTHPCFVAEFNLPNVNDFSTAHSVWVLPTPDGDDQLVLVDEKNLAYSSTLPKAMSDFNNYLGKVIYRVQDFEAEMFKTINQLSALFKASAEHKKLYPAIQKVLRDSAASLEEYKIDN